jgi:hypothetical protein
MFEILYRAIFDKVFKIYLVENVQPLCGFPLKDPPVSSIGKDSPFYPCKPEIPAYLK